MADDQNPFSQFSPEDQASIKEQLQALKESGKLNPAQSASVDSALGTVAKAGARAVIAPPKLDPVATEQIKKENAASANDATLGSGAREGVLGLASGLGLPETKNASDFSAVPGAVQMVTHPIESAKLVGGAMLDAQGQMLGKAKEDFSQAKDVLTGPGTLGSRVKNAAQLAGAGIVHTAGGVVPLVGPAAVGAGEEIGKGIQQKDPNAVMHGVGQGAGLLFSLKAGTKKGQTAGAAVEGAIDSGASKAANVLDESATKNINSVLSPTTKANKFLTQKLAPEIVDRGIVAVTRKGLHAKTAAAMDTSGAAIDAAIDALPKNKTVSTKPILDAMDQAKQDYVNTLPATPADLAANPQLVRKLPNGSLVKDVPIDPATIARIDDLKNVIELHGSDLSYPTLRKIRQVWDAAVAQGNGYAGKTLAEGGMLDAKQQAANAIRNELGKASPDIAKLNAEYSFWANANKVISDAIQRKTGQATPLTQQLATGSGAIVGGVVKKGIPGALEGAFLLKGVNKLINSTAWNTVSAQAKSKLANVIASGNQSAANSLANSLLAAGTAGQAVNKPLLFSGSKDKAIKQHLDSALADATAKGKAFDRNAETKKAKLLFQGVE